MSEFVDPYIDAKTGVLKNKVGASTYDELRNAEGELVASRISELFSRRILPDFRGTLDDMRFIHGFLFQDIYTWAGEIRTVEIRKNIKGAEFFLPSSNIAMGIAWAQDELVKDRMLNGLAPETFAQRLAYHYDNYNFVHPFREGNGRTQRLLWTFICHKAGYDLDWRKVTGEENDEASRLAAECREYDLLEKMLFKIAAPCNPFDPVNKEVVELGGRY